MVKKLIENRANINAVNKFNKTALIYALGEGMQTNFGNYSIGTIY